MSQSFEDDAQFAKVVETDRGEAVLIGGKVYHVTGPDGNAANLFSMAFCRMRGVDNMVGQAQSLGSYYGPSHRVPSAAKRKAE